MGKILEVETHSHSHEASHLAFHEACTQTHTQSQLIQKAVLVQMTAWEDMGHAGDAGGAGMGNTSSQAPRATMSNVHGL